MDYNTMQEIASENGLQFVETTSERSGYPRYIKGALIGFDDFQQAEEVAEKHNMLITIIEKHDGWRVWYRTGNSAHGPLEITEEVFGDDYSFLTGDENFFDYEVKPFLDGFDNLDDLIAFVNERKEIAEKLALAGDDYVVVTYQGTYYDTIDTKPMMFSYDTKTTAIALVDND